MTRSTSLGIPLPPCRLDPDAWRDHTNVEAKKACRTQCPRRFVCAQEAVRIEKIRTLKGVVAGIACPPDNDKGNSKHLTHAIDQLRSLAEFGAPRQRLQTPKPAVVAVPAPKVRADKPDARPLQLSFDDLLQAC